MKPLGGTAESTETFSAEQSVWLRAVPVVCPSRLQKDPKPGPRPRGPHVKRLRREWKERQERPHNTIRRTLWRNTHTHSEYMVFHHTNARPSRREESSKKHLSARARARTHTHTHTHTHT